MDDSSVHLSCQHIIDAGYVVNKKTILLPSNSFNGDHKRWLTVKEKLVTLGHKMLIIDRQEAGKFSIILFYPPTKQVYLVWL